MMFKVGETHKKKKKKKKSSSNGAGNDKEDIHKSYATMTNH
jgi:hypothetical protein